MKPLLICRNHKKRWSLWKISYIFKSWLEYQPAPIPFFNKTLPPNEISLIVISSFVLNVFYNFYHMPLSVPYLFVFADRCGLLFVANLPLLYFLSAKTQPLKLFTGQSYESLNIFHRRVGELLCFEAFLHCAGMIGAWYTLLRRIGFSLFRFLTTKLVGLGLGAFVAYEVLYLTSLRSFRQRCYEIFLALHIFLQLAGLILLYLHHRTSRPYVIISLAIFLIDRLVFRLYLKSSTHPATLTVLSDEETLLVSTNWDITPSMCPLSLFPVPHSTKTGWKPTDHVFLTVPALSMESHPFTIYSAAPTSTLSPSTEGQDPRHAWLTLLIRAHSGFTQRLLSHAHDNKTITIRLNGPYGSSHALDILSSSPNAIIVTGGSGIAVAYPLLWALLSPSSRSHFAPDIESGPTPPARSYNQKVRLLWIIHSSLHLEWFPEHMRKELEDWGLELYIPGPTSEVGRPEVKRILESWVGGEEKVTGVVVSGPDGLVRSVRNFCAKEVRLGREIRVGVEKFGW
ncbi:hypothetical protein GQ43DRAFT_363806 [Delitschia confertaspora ATCC 74209]|uniref:FAD-binding FR-type domain-containing protein n=1 Tax=Delitschia confertaspora ATCC 74209 TaxID=1513339 RepID=A0A9P4JUX7_9PLEO|nr:hypothetical protein GQ43DRAFT_363806 [Delitschia confertaspora ATCC 74209]